MKELKISKEAVLEASKTCHDAKAVLKALFTDVFKEIDFDVSKEISWVRDDFEGIGFKLRGKYKGEIICFIDGDGIYIQTPYCTEFKTVVKDNCFRILKTGK